MNERRTQGPDPNLREDKTGCWNPGACPTPSLGLTQLIPQLPALVCHASTLLPPQGQAWVLQKLLGHEDQHACPIGVSHPQHLPHLCANGVMRMGQGAGTRAFQPHCSPAVHAPQCMLCPCSTLQNMERSCWLAP